MNLPRSITLTPAILPAITLLCSMPDKLGEHKSAPRGRKPATPNPYSQYKRGSVIAQDDSTRIAFPRSGDLSGEVQYFYRVP